MHLEDFIASFDARLEAALDQTANATIAACRESAPEVLGNLKRSVRLVRWSRDERVVEATAPYASFVENGRDAVEAKAGSALHFFIGGVEIFARRVGPADPNRFMERARNEIDRTVSAIVEGELLGGGSASGRRGLIGRFKGSS